MALVPREMLAALRQLATPDKLNGVCVGLDVWIFAPDRAPVAKYTAWDGHRRGEGPTIAVALADLERTAVVAGELPGDALEEI